MVRRIAALCAASVFALPAFAADVTWSAPTDTNGDPSQVVNLGHVVAADTDGNSVTVNGVSFTGSTDFTAGTVTFGSEPITLTGMDVNDSHYGGAAPGDWDADYRNLLYNAAYKFAPNGSAINLSGLQVGKTYLIQIFEPFWDQDWPTIFTGGANSSGAVHLAASNTGDPAVPQFITGVFTADATTQTITMSTANSYAMFGGASLQMLGVPEPASWAMMVAGFGLAGTAMRRRRAAIRFA
jgi:hypothetical protein